MSNEKDKRLEDVIKEEQYWRQKQYDYEWESDYLNAKFCRDQANYYKNLIKKEYFGSQNFEF